MPGKFSSATRRRGRHTAASAKATHRRRDGEQRATGQPSVVQHGVQHDELPGQPMSALLAAQWADVVIEFLECCARAGLVDGNTPVDIVDLMPGPAGANCRIMHQALCERRGTGTANAFGWRLLPVAAERSQLASLRACPEWQAAQQDGWIVPMLWNRRSDPCLLTAAGRRPWKPGNPVIVLARQELAMRVDRVFAAHYGNLLEAAFEQLDAGEEAKQPWKPADKSSLSQPLLASLEAMLPGFNSIPLPWPEQPIAALERLLALIPGGHLVLSEAPGDASERSMRLRTFPQLMEDYRANRMMPLNFRLLAEYFGRCGAATAESEASTQRRAMQAMLAGPPARDKALLQRVAAVLRSDQWTRHAPLVAAAKELAAFRDRMSLDAALAILQSAACDREAFSVLVPALLAAVQHKRPGDPDGWADAAREVWSRHLPTAGDLLHREVAAVAMRMSDWGFAREVLTRGMLANGRQASDLGYLAWCEFRTGRIEPASRLLDEALARDAGDAIANEVRERLNERLNTRNAKADPDWCTPIAHPTLPLVLEPLDCLHAEALLYQYRDPQIAIMTGLPPLTTLDETRKWIVEHDQEAGRHGYALMHRDHGLVGYVCLSNSGQSTYFCFWIGVDHQGKAWSTPAARLACDHARTRGIAQFFTSIYDDNLRSMRSLARVGFKPMQVRALPPDQDRCFYYYCDADVSEQQATAELIDYHIREKLPLRFPGVEPVAQAAEPASPALPTMPDPPAEPATR